MTNVRMNKLLRCASAESCVNFALLWEDEGFRQTMFSCDGLSFDESMARLLNYINENY